MTRPEPGLARGAWEAPAWALWGVLALIVLGSAAYLAYRLGLHTPRKGADRDAPSSRMRRP